MQKPQIDEENRLAEHSRRLMRFFTMFKARIEREKPFGSFSNTQAYCLFAIAEHEHGYTLAQLAQYTGMERSQVSNALDYLMRQNLLDAVPNPAHKGQLIYTISPASFAAVQKLFDDYVAAMEAVYRDFDLAEKSMLNVATADWDEGPSGVLTTKAEYTELTCDHLGWVLHQIFYEPNWPKNWDSDFQSYGADAVKKYNQGVSDEYAGVLALLAGREVGLVLANYESEFTIVNIDLVMVKPNFRNRGIATGLINGVVKRAKELGAVQVRIKVRQTDHKLVRAVGRAEFKKYGTAQRKDCFGTSINWVAYRYDLPMPRF